MVLALNQICHRFFSGDLLLNGVTFTLEKGSVSALMGANGSGKTTLFNIISGFVEPAVGELYFIPEPGSPAVRLSGIKPYQRMRLGIGRTFQDLRLISKLTVRENIVLVMKNNPTEGLLNAMLPKTVFQRQLSELDQQADQLLKEYFLTDVADCLAGEISYGQQKLLNLACVMAGGSSLLLLDEPVAGIQPEYREKVLYLLQLIAQQGRTILLIEHNTDFIASLADRILFLQGGSISEFESVESLRISELVKQTYF